MSPKHQQEGQLNPRFQRADGVRQPQRGFLLDEMNPNPELRAVADEAGDLIAAVADHDVDLRDAAAAHHLDLMAQEGPIQYRKDRFRAPFGKRIHPRAFAGGEDDANHPSTEINQLVLPSPYSEPAPA